MDIVKLKTFCRVYELRSFSKAASDLFMSQPTVSSHILAIEKELQQRVFDRIGKSIIPTPTGELLYNYAKQILSLLSKASIEAKLLKNEVVGTIKVAASTIPGTYIFPSIISEFLHTYPNVKVVLDISDSHVVYQKVIGGEIDISICGANYNNAEVHNIKILEDKLVFVGHKKFFNRVKKIEDVISIPWIMREKGSRTRMAIERELINKNISTDQINIRCTVSNTQGLLSLVREGVGITVTSIFAAKKLLSSDYIVLKEFPFFEFKRNFYLSYNKLRTLFPASKIFIDFILDKTKSLNMEKLKLGDKE